MTKKTNGDVERRVDMALMAYQIGEIHKILPELGNRVTVLEKGYTKITAWATGAAFVVSILWTALTHIFRGNK